MNSSTHRNIGAQLAKRAAITPQREVFVEFERGRRFTFAETNARCNRLAHALLAMDLEPGDRVAVLAKNSIEFVESYYACAKIGCVLVPVNWRLAPPEIAYILADSGAFALIYDSEFEDSLAEAAAHPDYSLTLQHRLCIGGSSARAADYDAVTADASTDEPPLQAQGDDLLFIMYTSGTTGHPKGVMQSHTTMLWAHLTSLTTSDIRGDDRYMLPLPMFHVAGLNPISLVVHRGASGVIMRDLEMGAMFRCIDQEKVNIFTSVPALLQFMLDVPERQQYDLSSVRWISTGAAPVPVSLLRKYEAEGIAIHQAYGLTEACGPGTLLLPEDAEAKVGSCGRPQMHTEARLVDMDGKDIPRGSDEPGEILLSGPHMMLGYWNKPEATAETLVDGWLHTGDIATWDADGFFTICDRKKDMIISGGENIYPAEIENALAACPEVKEAAVIGVASEKWGETPLAIVVAEAEQSPTADTLKAWCSEHLAGYKVPRLYEFVELLPRNASGKLNKPQLRERFPGPAPF
ncbi:MAG: long-chain fatty acid--CoA ligase [Pseudomonadota bacterium]